MADAVLGRLSDLVARYLATLAEPGEYLSLLRWQLAQGHRLDRRATLPGHLTTSAIILSSDHRQTLLIDHRVIGRWLQPGGHYEGEPAFQLSARREATEETGIGDLALHPWHRGGDLPFSIDSHEVPGNPHRAEGPHIHHDLQYLFRADAHAPLSPQQEEVNAAAWKPVEALADFAPRVLRRIHALP